MTLQEKQSLIKENREAAIAALNSYLDKIYSLTDDYFDEENNLLNYLSEDEKVENFVKGLRDNAKDYEKVREKLTNNDFNLSLFEINIVALSFYYINIRWEKQIEQLKAAKIEAQNIISALMEKKDLDI